MEHAGQTLCRGASGWCYPLRQTATRAALADKRIPRCWHSLPCVQLTQRSLNGIQFVTELAHLAVVLPARWAIEIKACVDADPHQIGGLLEDLDATGNSLSVASSAAGSQAKASAVDRPAFTAWQIKHIAFSQIRAKDQRQLLVPFVFDFRRCVFTQSHHYIVSINNPVTGKGNLPEVSRITARHIRVGVGDIEGTDLLVARKRCARTAGQDQSKRSQQPNLHRCAPQEYWLVRFECLHPWPIFHGLFQMLRAAPKFG